jgi:hypothetical protein
VLLLPQSNRRTIGRRRHRRRVPARFREGASAVRSAMGSGARRRRPIRQRVRVVLRGGLGRLVIGVAPFELSNVAATLLILRATDLSPSNGVRKRGRRAPGGREVAAARAPAPSARRAISFLAARRHGRRRAPVRSSCGFRDL